MNRRDRLLNNTALNGVGRLVDAAVSLVLVAYIVRTIGLEAYGLWAIVAAFTGYAALFDIGLGGAYSRFVAEHAARNDDRRISEIVSTGVTFYLVFGAIFVGVGWFAVDGIVYLIGWLATGAFTPENLAEFRFLLRGAIVLFAVSNCLAPFTALQTGLQRMGVTNALSIIAAAVKLIATVYFLERGLGVRGLIYAQGSVVTVFGGMTVATAFVVAPQLSLRVRHVSRETFMSLYRFGWRTQFARLANLIMFETDVLVIALLLRNLELAGLYKIGVELANKMRYLPGVLVSAVVPAAADFHTRGETETLRKLYLRATKYSAAVAIPLAGFLAAAAIPILKTWVGPVPGLTTAAGVIQVMAIGYIANMVPGAGVSIALGMGEAGLQMRAGFVSMIANIVLTVALALTIGFWGIPLATAASMALSWAWFAFAMRGALDLPVYTLWKEALRWPALAGAAVLTVTVIAVIAMGDVEGRMANAALLVGLALMAAGTYAVVARWAPLFDDYDRQVIRRAIALPGEWVWKHRLPAG